MITVILEAFTGIVEIIMIALMWFCVAIAAKMVTDSDDHEFILKPSMQQQLHNKKDSL